MEPLSQRADLHCHTNISDSSVSIKETVEMAAKRGLRALAITDHDTMDAVDEAVFWGEKFKIEIIPGIEFSTFDYKRKRKVHILAYGLEGNKRLEKIYTDTLNERNRAGNIMAERLLKLYPLSKEMLLKYSQNCSGIYKQHFMHALMDAGYASCIFGDDFNRLFSSKGGLVYESITYPDVLDVLKTAKEEGVVVSLAHPINYNSEELFEELAQKQLIDAVEVWHETANEKETQFLYESAQKYGLIMTGGTDFHGMYHSEPTTIASYTTAYSEYEKIKKLIYK